MQRSEQESDEVVVQWRQQIAEQVQEINRIKMEVQNPEERMALVCAQINASVVCVENITCLTGQPYALHVLVEEYSQMTRL